MSQCYSPLLPTPSSYSSALPLKIVLFDDGAVEVTVRCGLCRQDTPVEMPHTSGSWRGGYKEVNFTHAVPHTCIHCHAQCKVGFPW